MEGSTPTAGAYDPVEHLRDVDHVAGVLGCSTAHVRALVRGGQLKGYRLGHHTLRFSDEQIRAFLAEHEVA